LAVLGFKPLKHTNYFSITGKKVSIMPKSFIFPRIKSKYAFIHGPDHTCLVKFLYTDKDGEKVALSDKLTTRQVNEGMKLVKEKKLPKTPPKEPDSTKNQDPKQVEERSKEAIPPLSKKSKK